MSNVITLDQLKEAMHLGALGEQIVLKSETAFSQIVYTGCLETKASKYFKLASDRDKEARRLYRKLAQETTFSRGVFMADIIREGMMPDDPRLQ